MNAHVTFTRERRGNRSFSFLVADGFLMHSPSSAIAPLSTLNKMTGVTHYSWACVSDKCWSVRSECGFVFETDVLDQFLTPSDVLTVCDGVNGSDFYGPQVIKWLRKHAAHGGVVSSFGNGGYALAQAGLLRDNRFTVHWAHQQALTENYPLLEPTNKVFEIDGNVLTSAGGLAAMDLSLALIGRDFSPATARRVAEICLYANPRTDRDTQRAPLSAVLDTRNQILINAVSEMRRNLESPLELHEMAEAQNVSRRQLERLFRKHLHCSPGRYYRELRLEHARCLLHETDLPVTEIAFACGYNSTATFTKNFRSQFVSGPHAYRAFSRRPKNKNHAMTHMEGTS